MAKHRNDRDVLDRINELREAHAPMRCEIAVRAAMGIGYNNSRQWMSFTPATPSAQPAVESLNEDWNPKAQEIRVVDNRVGPLCRRISASTNATRIEAAVSPPKQQRTINASKRASVSQNVLNAIEADALFTLTARSASALRWLTGSSLLVVKACKKSRSLPNDIAMNPDGSPVEINDQWVRWEYAPLCDLIWDPSNVCPDLERHSTLILEEFLTWRKFEQMYGPLSEYGIDKDQLPTIRDIAPHYCLAGAARCGIFSQYAGMSQEKALRVVTLMEADDRDPGRWPEMYTVIDVTSRAGSGSYVDGRVVNMDNPVTCYGASGRNVIKLDGYRSGESVWSWGIPHILTGSQDLLNISRSIQTQQMSNAVYGIWKIDTKAGMDRVSFMEALGSGIGTAIEWSSNNGGQAPEWEVPQAPQQEFVAIAADFGIGMRDAVHISPANLGIGKSHVPEATQQALLNESAVVIDNIILADQHAYADALRVTLGTVRMAMEQPNRMLARLRDQHDFTPGDLMTFLEVDPYLIKLDVTVREASIISRSAEERVGELRAALENQIISPIEFRSELSTELERPLLKSDELQIDFINRELIKVMSGHEWIGLPSLDYGIFKHCVDRAIYGLDTDNQDDMAAMARLQGALITQQSISMELNGGGDPNAQGAAPAPDQPASASFLPDRRGGAPESINPRTNPVAASGGLPLGLTG